MAIPPPLNQTLRPGMIIDHGRYKLVRQIGAGGNGVVWLAIHEGMKAETVIKLSKASCATDSAAKNQLEQELRSLVAFSSSHPHIVNLLDVGSIEGRPFVVMQYLRRGSLLEYCSNDRQKRQQADRLCNSADWLVAIASALNHIHSHNFLHRDVKPANILLDDSFSAYLADFGIATPHAVAPQKSRFFHEMNANALVGSLPYMAPELLVGASASVASDQYGLAMTAYEFLLARHPFVASNVQELIELHRDTDNLLQWNPADSISREMWNVLRQALDPDPAKRFPSCLAFAQELASIWTNCAPTQNNPDKPDAIPTSSDTQNSAGSSTQIASEPTATMASSLENAVSDRKRNEPPPLPGSNRAKIQLNRLMNNQ